MIMMILVSLIMLCTLVMTADANANANANASALDFLLQEYGIEAIFDEVRPKTGVAYDGAVPRNITGIRVTAMRLKSGSLLTRGVSMYREFEIPKGVVTHPYVERLALIYYNLANWSTAYYPPLDGYTYLAPVLGLLAYEYEVDVEPNVHLPRLYIRASVQPISIHFSHLLLMPNLSPPPNAKCVFFDVNGSLALTDMLPDNVCTTFQEGHFSIVVDSTSIPMWKKEKKKNSSKIVGGVIGGFALLVMLGMAVGWASRYRRSKKKKTKMHSMETAAEVGEVLHMIGVGTTKAPAAIGTRTLPKLETDYVP